MKTVPKNQHCKPSTKTKKMIVLWFKYIPVPEAYNQQKWRDFLEQLKQFREWLPKVKWYVKTLNFRPKKNTKQKQNKKQKN